MIAIAILFTSSRNPQKENNCPATSIAFRLTSEVLLDRLGQKFNFSSSKFKKYLKFKKFKPVFVPGNQFATLPLALLLHEIIFKIEKWIE